MVSYKALNTEGGNKKLCLNRTFMELKLLILASLILNQFVLIEPLWN